jgi:hypothetical protein
MSKTCKNCKHWSISYEPDKDNIADCNKIDTWISSKDDSAHIKYYLDDDSGLEISFMTGANFGCNKFKPK